MAVSNADLLFVIIKDRDANLFDGNARAISSWNDSGPFDILPQHENFICIIKKFITIHLPDKSTKVLKIETGLLKVYANKVEIYLGTLPYGEAAEV